MQWLEEISHESLVLWQAFYQVEPWGDEYERHAVQSQLTDQVSSTIAAVNGTKSKPRSIEYYMPSNWDGAKRKAKPKSKKVTVADLQKKTSLLAAIFPTADGK